jgi:hypothetical protein
MSQLLKRMFVPNPNAIPAGSAAGLLSRRQPDPIDRLFHVSRAGLDGGPGPLGYCNAKSPVSYVFARGSAAAPVTTSRDCGDAAQLGPAKSP